MNKIYDRKTKKDMIKGYIRNRYIKDNKMFMIAFIVLLIGIATVYNALAIVYPSYNTEQDCRGCHGIVANRHHLLVSNGTYRCTDCHAMKFDSQNQTYYPEIIRNCLICHPGKNHTDTHHIFVSQGLFVCTDCHPILYDGQNQTYYPKITWDCTVCHSTVLSIQNGTPGPTPTPTPTPTQPIPPSITIFSPISPVRDIVGSPRDFSITTDQIVNVRWYINDNQIQYNEGVTYTNYHNTSANLGVWNVSAVASNINGTVKYTWIWNVTNNIRIPPTIIFYAPYSPLIDRAGTIRKFGIATDQIVNIRWSINGVDVQSNMSVTGASYTNTSSSPGEWFVLANANNENGSVSHSWNWNVVESTPPVTTINLSGISGTNGWNISDVQVILVAIDDGGSGVANTRYRINSGAWITYTGPFIITNEGVSTIEYNSTDNVGNIELVKIQTIKIDKTLPQVTINSPVNGTIYIMNQNLIADWSVNDAISGIGTVMSTYPNGGIINTTSVGTKNFSIHATDSAGNVAKKNVTYYVRYNFGRFLEPVNNDGSSIFKLGSTVPIKFQLTDANGNYVTSAVATLNISKITQTITGTYLEPYTTGSGTAGYTFIYETNGNRYSYNLMTKSLSVGTWRIRVDIDDGSFYAVNISLKK